MPKLKSTRLSPIRVVFVTKKYNKHPSRFLEEALNELVQKGVIHELSATSFQKNVNEVLKV